MSTEINFFRQVALDRAVGLPGLAPSDIVRAADIFRAYLETGTVQGPDLAGVVADAIKTFAWSNYGLDEVDEADDEYADHLAAHILAALGRTP